MCHETRLVADYSSSAFASFTTPVMLTFTTATFRPVIVSTVDFTFSCTSAATFCTFVPNFTIISISTTASFSSFATFTHFVWPFLPKNSVIPLPWWLPATTPSTSSAAVTAITPRQPLHLRSGSDHAYYFQTYQKPPIF